MRQLDVMRPMLAELLPVPFAGAPCQRIMHMRSCWCKALIPSKPQPYSYPSFSPSAPTIHSLPDPMQARGVSTQPRLDGLGRVIAGQGMGVGGVAGYARPGPWSAHDDHLLCAIVAEFTQVRVCGWRGA